MARKPKATVRIYPKIQSRILVSGKTRYIVRWRLGNKSRDKGFTSNREAKIFHSQLTVAESNPVTKWNPDTGLPIQMSDLSDVTVASWAKDYLGEQWPDLAPNTRRSMSEALVCLVERSMPDRAPFITGEIHRAIRLWLSPAGDVKESLRDRLDQQLSWSPRLEELDEHALHRLDTRLRQDLDGNKLARNSQSRRVGVVKRCLKVAVKRGLMTSCDWPEPELGASRRKSSRNTAPTDVPVPSVKQLEQILAAIPSHQPSSVKYQILSAVCAYAGLRPGEAIALQVEDLDLPKKGWGQLTVTRSWNGVGEDWGTEEENQGEPKTYRNRPVPIPPVLVAQLQHWIDTTSPKDSLFVNDGKRPTQSNWNRALKRACETAGVAPLSPYGLRRTYASHLVDANVMIAEAAARLGHSPEVLLTHYLKRMSDGEARSNKLLDAIYSS